MRKRLTISSDDLATLEREVELAVANAVEDALRSAPAAGEEVLS